MLAKTEFVLLERIIPVLADENIPQLTQTGFQKGVSCADAIFSCLETISKCIREGDSVKQGSVLSPVLFLLVMDPILLALKNKPCGLNICGLYLGAFSHADDIRTLASSKSDCSHHISSVEDFASSRGLKLSVEKCEAVISPSSRNAPLSLSDKDI